MVLLALEVGSGQRRFRGGSSIFLSVLLSCQAAPHVSCSQCFVSTGEAWAALVGGTPSSPTHDSRVSPGKGSLRRDDATVRRAACQVLAPESSLGRPGLLQVTVSQHQSGLEQSSRFPFLVRHSFRGAWRVVLHCPVL